MVYIYISKEMAMNLLKLFSFTGPPSAMLSDQGSNYLSRVLPQIYVNFAICHVQTSPYHPESNSQLERLHSTLKKWYKE